MVHHMHIAALSCQGLALLCVAFAETPGDFHQDQSGQDVTGLIQVEHHQRREVARVADPKAVDPVSALSRRSYDCNLSELAASLDGFDWCNNDEAPGGINYCTSVRNQLLPQYCDAGWAFAGASSLADRIKIMRKAQGPDIIISVQHTLNCVPKHVASCRNAKRSPRATWFYLDEEAKPRRELSYESAQPYMACSSDSDNGVCPHADWSCKPMNIARTCSTFPIRGGTCAGLQYYPNVSIRSAGIVHDVKDMMAEIHGYGPISCSVFSGPLNKYTGGVMYNAPDGSPDHVVSVTGWGTDAVTDTRYWWVRNSWGQAWGELGFARVAFGELGIERNCVWGDPEKWWTNRWNQENNAYEDGSNVASNDTCGIWCSW